MANERGERIIDFRRHNLHVMQYSTPVRARMSLEELRPRLHSLPDRPDAIPYRTSYYKEAWGFCVSDRQLQAMEPGEYQVVIDSSLTEGSLTYGELFIPGETADEVLFHAHICHPSLANDNLSGLVVAAYLADEIRRTARRYSYRFVFLPGTIGPITWLALNEDRTSRIRHGLVLTGIGDPGAFTYKRSRRGAAPIDRALQHLLKWTMPEGRVCDFEPYGYDRAAVLLAWFQSAGRLSDAHAARDVPRISHLRRQSRFRTRGKTRRRAEAVDRSGASAGTRSTMCESLAQGGAAARQARTV